LEDGSVKIRDAKPDELVQPALARKLSPRQQAAQEREARFRKLLESLSDPAQIKAIEPEKDEKLSTLQASAARWVYHIGYEDPGRVPAEVPSHR
jgi:hypothetical protein